MDLSAVIFVALALAWAVYLIPKALQHHDTMAGERLVESHTDRVRILRRSRVRIEESLPAEGEAPLVGTEEVSLEVSHDVVEGPVGPSRAERRRAARLARRTARAETLAAAPLPTRASARRAAQRRRRVLGVLLGVTVVVAALAGFSVVPWWSLAVPAVLVVAFLVVARVSVRRHDLRRVGAAPVEEARTAEPVAAPTSAAAPVAHHEEVVERAALAASDGELWDPVPLTLPTYVGKARARRTVRTIELTGLQSSGHSDADSALAREAEAQASEAAAADQADADRRVAGA